MKKFFVISAIFALAVSIASCTTTRKDRLAKIKVGMSKNTVLDIVGNPSRSGRVSGGDRWSYDFWTGEQRRTFHIHFVDGRVRKAGLAQKIVEDRFKPVK